MKIKEKEYYKLGIETGQKDIDTNLRKRMYNIGYNKCLNKFEKLIDKLDKNLESSDGLNFRNKLLNKIKELKYKDKIIGGTCCINSYAPQ